ncbi:MAG: hypothetical protein JRI23_26830 [Deltaproteobacteria bacterium]|jgi:MYXO-CTERM domain-containing protein|nr:hypothetical protein [Deltaproteobacteria bacterium]MBW2535676.1 hypothetical protein [Deltaproteobacteria bacterium]
MRRTIPFVLAAPLALSVFVVSAGCTSSDSGGEGNINDCGDIHVEASAECTVEVEGGCEAQCTPVSFQASCEGRCEAIQCSASCQGECEAECEVDPPSFTCEAGCEAQCGADCEASCSGDCEADPGSASCSGECQATCEASCQGSCSANCEGTPGEADCSAKCEGSCEASCTGGCEGSCEVELTGGCEVACQTPEGALFCDGQYVDHNGNMASCIAALNAMLDVEVDASASAACGDGACEASAEGEVTCGGNSIGPKPSSQSLPWYVAGLAALGMAGLLRRRRRS